MQFLYPGFLYALAAVLIPLIIHLFRFRRYRKVYFSNVRLIEDLQLETRRRSRLKHILVLLARMLAIAALVLAFAQPYQPLTADQNVTSRDNVILYLDNSFSMEAVADDGSLFQVAREKAEEIAKAYDPSDQFALLTNDFEGRLQRFYSQEEVLDFLQSIEPGPVYRNLTEVMTRARDMAADAGGQTTLYVLSDYQKSFTETYSGNEDSTLNVFLVPLTANALSNLYIDSCWFSSPVRYTGQTAELVVRVVNTGEGDYEKVPLRLKVNGEQVAVASLDIPAGQSVEEKMRLNIEEGGWHAAVAEITDYPVTYDDSYYFVYSSADRISVMALHQESPSSYLPALFRSDSSYDYRQQDALSLDYSSLASYDLIILENLKQLSSGLTAELNEFVSNGGSLVIFPGTDIAAQEYNMLLQPLGLGLNNVMDTTRTRVSSLDTEHPLFEGVFEKIQQREGQRMDYPVVLKHYPLAIERAGSSSAIMQLENGRPFLAGGHEGMGQVWAFASPLGDEYSGLPRHAMIVPILYRIAMLSRPMRNLSNTIGKDKQIRIPVKGTIPEVIEMRNRGTEDAFIPGVRRMGAEVILSTHGQVRNNGIYEIADGKNILGLAAYNFDRRESDLIYHDTESLQELATRGGDNLQILDINLQSAGEAVAAINEGQRYYKWFIVLALLFLLIEVFLLRFMKG